MTNEKDGHVRVLTVRQPWAWAIIHAGKNVENRPRRTFHRGTLLIHAGLKTDPYGVAFLEALGVNVPSEALAGGMLVGSVQLTDCVQGSTSRWAQAGHWHWLLKDSRPVTAVVKCKGQLAPFPPPPGWRAAFR